MSEKIKFEMISREKTNEKIFPHLIFVDDIVARPEYRWPPYGKADSSKLFLIYYKNNFKHEIKIHHPIFGRNGLTWWQPEKDIQGVYLDATITSANLGINTSPSIYKDNHNNIYLTWIQDGFEIQIEIPS